MHCLFRIRFHVKQKICSIVKWNILVSFIGSNWSIVMLRFFISYWSIRFLYQLLKAKYWTPLFYYITVTMELTISPSNYINVCFIYLKDLILGIYIYLLYVLKFYHYVMPFFASCKSLWPNFYFCLILMQCCINQQWIRF